MVLRANLGSLNYFSDKSVEGVLVSKGTFFKVMKGCSLIDPIPSRPVAVDHPLASRNLGNPTESRLVLSESMENLSKTMTFSV